MTDTAFTSSAAMIESMSPARSSTHPAARRARYFAAFAAVLVVGACANGRDGGDAGRFCGEIEANRAAIVDPQLVHADDVEPLLELYRSIGELAPLSIETEWDQLTRSYETADAVVPGDPESEQLAVATALQSEESATAVGRWLKANCAIDIGAVATIVAQG